VTETSAYQRKPFRVQAIQVTDDNLTDLAEWCGGWVKLEEDGFDTFKSYVDVPIAKPAGRYRLQRVRAYVGDWLVRLTEDNVFKIYKTRSFLEIFEEVASEEKMLDSIRGDIRGFLKEQDDTGYYSFPDVDWFAEQITKKVASFLKEGK
jgi:hypothetical protein